MRWHVINCTTRVIPPLVQPYAIFPSTWGTVSTSYIWQLSCVYQWTTHFLLVHKWVILCCLSIVVRNDVVTARPVEFTQGHRTSSAPMFWLHTNNSGREEGCYYDGWDGSNWFNHLFIVELGRHSVLSKIHYITWVDQYGDQSGLNRF